MDPIEIEQATALRPREILTAYQCEDKGLIFLIEKYCPYNKKFYSQHQKLLKDPTPTPRHPHQFKLHITKRELSENKTMALERLHTKIYQRFERVPYHAWVKVACGIIPDEVLDLQVEIRAMYYALPRSLVTEQWKRSPFAHLFARARDSDMPEIKVDLIAHPIREYVNDERKTLAQILQCIDNFKPRFKEHGYKLFWEANASDDSSHSDMTAGGGYTCPKREDCLAKFC